MTNPTPPLTAEDAASIVVNKWHLDVPIEEQAVIIKAYDRAMAHNAMLREALTEAYREINEISARTGSSRNQLGMPMVDEDYFLAVGIVTGKQAGSYRDWETDRKSTRLNSSHRL